MEFKRRSWKLVLCVVVVLIASIAVAAHFFSGRAPVNMPHFPVVSEILELSAEMNGTLFGLPVTDRFDVPREYLEDVCQYFTGEVRKWDVKDRNAIEKSKLGELYFQLNGGGHFEVSFFTVGKGAIGARIGSDYFVVDTPSHDGGLSLLLVLDRAFRAANAKPQK